jgi:hypothetical protein
MNRVGFAPAGQINVVRLSLAGLIAAAALAVGLLSSPAAALADGTTNSCNAVVNVVCVGQINGTPVTVNVGNVSVLSGNALSILTQNLNQNYLSLVNVHDINILSADLTTLVTTTVNSWVNTVVNNTVNTITTTCSTVVAPPAATTGMSAITIGCT